MELNQLFEMQAELDRHIEEKHQLEHEDLFDRKVLALLVEIGELANETRSFKFWSTRPSSDKALILEEFVDGIHFILSLGIECGYENDTKVMIPEHEGTSTINEQFLKVYESITLFRNSRSIEHYLNVFQSYMELSNLLGFEHQDMVKAYISKNEVNYKRQKQGY